MSPRAVVLSIVVLLITVAQPPRAGSQPAPGSQISGTIPGPGQMGLLVATASALPAAIVGELADRGCSAESIAVIVSGKWVILIPGAPPAVNGAFMAAVPTFVALTPFFVRCAEAQPPPSLAALQYRVIDRFGRVWFCDPDFYPIARADEAALAAQRFPEIRADGAVFAAILARLGYAPAATFTAEQQLAIYREWKMLRALRLEPTVGGYHFVARFTSDERTGTLVDGTVSATGQIVVSSQVPSTPPPCPICLTLGTLIATPAGPVAIEDLREGIAVWTTDIDGLRIASTVTAVGSVVVPTDLEVTSLVLSDGRELRASPGHPLADGRRVGNLARGDEVDGAIVLVSEFVRYAGGKTLDLLPEGPTGTYWADGVLLGSTLRR